MAWASAYLFIAPTLPDTQELSKTKLQTPLQIYSLDGKLIGRYGSKNHKTISYDNTPQILVQAFLAAEDDRFFQHNGVDFKSLARALFSYFNNSQRLSGGSTITMQLAKMYFLSYDKTIQRKLNQIFLAWHIELHHSKADILELYLNKIFLGNHAYGVATAAQTYYNKTLPELTLAETAMIAGLPKAPSANNPLANPDKALERRNWILKRMYSLGYIDYLNYIDAKDQPITAKRYKQQLSKIDSAFAYPAELARKQAFKLFGESIYSDGYRIYTTIDSRLQRNAKRALEQGLNAYAQRHGYRGPETHIAKPSQYLQELEKKTVINGLYPAVITSVESHSLVAMLKDKHFVELQWEDGIKQARPFIDSDHIGPQPQHVEDILQPGDLIRLKKVNAKWRLTQIPKAQAALIAIAPQNGKILAMSGGFDYRWSKFNRATQAKRQPGSNLKPLLYAAAMELNNLTATTKIVDEPLEFETENGIWKPSNAGGKFYGPTSLRKALYFSRNVVSIKLLEQLGINNFITYLSGFGLQPKDLPKDLSLALGSNSVAPIQVANIFSDIANGGYHIKPHLISRIDHDGQAVYYSKAPVSCIECNNYFTDRQIYHDNTLTRARDQDTLLRSIAKPSPKLAPRVMNPQVNYILDSILRDVIDKGTGRRAQALERPDIRGKTGTTNGPLDAWFSGYHPDIAVTTWLGFDQNEKLGRREFGGSAALPIWISFMHQALKDVPEKYIPQPEGIVSVDINPKTGQLLPQPTSSSVKELFRIENVKRPPSDSTANNTQQPSFGDENTIETRDNQVLIYDTQLGAYIQADQPQNLHINPNEQQQNSTPLEQELERMNKEQPIDQALPEQVQDLSSLSSGQTLDDTEITDFSDESNIDTIRDIDQNDLDDGVALPETDNLYN